MCLRPIESHLTEAALALSQTPLGERVPSASAVRELLETVTLVSNPSRGTCAFGPTTLVHPPGFRTCLKPLSGNVCLRPKALQQHNENEGWSQTPLGERVPSALNFSPPLVMPVTSQTPLGERVPSAFGTDTLPHITGAVSNPSRGTCAFGLKTGNGQFI